MSATLEEFADPKDEENPRVVVAKCSACGSVHPLASRQVDDDTAASTVCPECYNPSYTTEVRDRREGSLGEEVVGK